MNSRLVHAKRGRQTKLAFFAMILSALFLGSIVIIHNLSQASSTSVVEKSGTWNHGLQLQLELSSNAILSGNVINLTMSEYNTAAQSVNVSASSNWALNSLPNENCPSGDGPVFALLIFNGYYTESNVSSATPLSLTPPRGLTSCPALDFSYFLFRPESSTVTVLRVGNSLVGPSTMNINLIAPAQLRGYYSVSQTRLDVNGSVIPAFVPFSPGPYTMVVGDEWGNIVFAYLEVV